jgi:peptidoglycan hydrolase-like protein with peptidoglycan-binding domain
MKLGAGTKAAAVQAAEPRSTAPLRILVTRRTQRDRIIGVQRVLSDLGYLMPQEFDGTLGRASASAIKEFQKANGMPETGALTDELANKVYEVAGRTEPPSGHLFVRQEFGRVFDAPVNFRDPETPLGTHLFTAMKFEPGDTKTRWMAVSVQGDDPAGVLDRLEIPNDVRQKISERLTPGSSLIVGDIAINSATLPKGADFLVWAKDTPAKFTTTSIDGYISQPRPKKKKKRTVRRNYNTFTYTPPRNFGRSPWPW